MQYQNWHVWILGKFAGDDVADWALYTVNSAMNAKEAAARAAEEAATLGQTPDVARAYDIGYGPEPQGLQLRTKQVFEAYDPVADEANSKKPFLIPLLDRTTEPSEIAEDWDDPMASGNFATTLDNASTIKSILKTPGKRK